MYSNILNQAGYSHSIHTQSNKSNILLFEFNIDLPRQPVPRMTPCVLTEGAVYGLNQRIVIERARARQTRFSLKAVRKRL